MSKPVLCRYQAVVEYCPIVVSQDSVMVATSRWLVVFTRERGTSGGGVEPRGIGTTSESKTGLLRRHQVQHRAKVICFHSAIESGAPCVGPFIDGS